MANLITESIIVNYNSTVHTNYYIFRSITYNRSVFIRLAIDLVVRGGDS